MVFAVSVASSPKVSPAGLVVGADVLGGLGGVCAKAGPAIDGPGRAANKPARIAKPIAFSLIEHRPARFLMFVDLPLPWQGVLRLAQISAAARTGLDLQTWLDLQTCKRRLIYRPTFGLYCEF